MSTGEKLRELRTGRSKTLKEQSDIAGVSLNTAYRWEHGRALPRRSSLKKIAAFYNVPFEWLIGTEGAEANITTADVYPDGNTENQLLTMYRALPNNSKFMILGYIERVYVEDNKPSMKAMQNMVI